MIGRPEIEAAQARIAPHIRTTPVLTLEPGALGLGQEIWMKLEHLQVTGTYKVRGAFNNLLAADLPAAGVVAFSGGNHGAAVAYAATKLGVHSKIFLAEAWANPVKIARMEGFGGEVVTVPGTVANCMRAYTEYAEATGAFAAHPYDGPGTLIGQGTVGLEIERQIDGIDTLFVSVGGGGLIGGIAAWCGHRIKVVAVETEGTSTLAQTLAEGPGIEMNPTGVAASSLGAPSIGDLPLAVLKDNLGDIRTVTDAQVYDAQRRLWDAARVIGEPGAATALAALTSGAYVPGPDERVGVLICGANAAPGWFLD